MNHRAWEVDRLAVASSLGVYVRRPETRWTEDLALPTAQLPHQIVAFKKAVEAVVTHDFQGSDVRPYISAVLRGETPPPLHTEDGGDRCYAPDAGRAISLLMTTETLRHDIYNVSSGRPATNDDFAAALEAAIPGLRLDLLPGREGGRGEDPYLDITRLAEDTGFTPAFEVERAVADYVAWRAGNPR